MIHPSMQLRWISDAKELGLVAVAPIPKGTITFVQDPLDIAIHVQSDLLKDKRLRKYIEKYSYLNHQDEFVISWDGGKYMNHCCHANTLTTGYGFEIAIRDIAVGEEVTDDYGVFTIRHNMTISCNLADCRGRVDIDDFDRCLAGWDAKVLAALDKFTAVDQALIDFVDDETKLKISQFLETGEGYVSVAEQKANPERFYFWTQKNGPGK